MVVITIFKFKENENSSLTTGVEDTQKPDLVVKKQC